MRSTADTYRIAANEHLKRALWLHNQQEYYLSHYVSGLAAECMLRAYQLRITREFSARHDLGNLAREARFYEHIPQNEHAEYGAALNTLNVRWRSNHRYATELQLWQYLTGIKAGFGKKGNQRQLNSRELYNLAYKIVSLGERKWTRR